MKLEAMTVVLLMNTNKTRVKALLDIDYDADIDELVAIISDTIEQSEQYRPKIDQAL